jgi:hypothetical protein
MDIPPPDLTHRSKFAGDLNVIETIYSEDKWAKVEITKDTRNIYRIHPQRWDVSDLTIIGSGYWSQWGHGASITDDISIARQLALEAVRAIPRSVVIPDD